MEKQNFRTRLIEWYDGHKRALPWRQTRDPYLVWLSEIILQQTRVAQGLPYYQQFVKHFPQVQHLADAKQEEVLKLWEGLGYYSRARNMHAAARQVVNQYDGKFPDTYTELLKLRGVGAYTAAAIASFAYGLPHAVLDGNVYRVLARLFGVYEPINTPKAQKLFGALAQELLDQSQPGVYNQAIMEFGATQCTPKNPDCSVCPFESSCYAEANGVVQVLPAKAKAKPKRNRYFYYVQLMHGGEVLVQQRGENDIWQGLYEFPLLETPEPLEDVELLNGLTAASLWNSGAVLKQTVVLKPHLLSHQKLMASVLCVELSTRKGLQDREREWVGETRLKQLPMPVLLRKYLNQNQLPLPF